jgi:hypothetical protein
MKANELRIGNLLKKIIDNKIIEVTSLEIECCEGMNGHFNLTFEPIPLTEEWHNRFGVLKNGFNSFEYKLKNNLNLYLTVIFTDDYVMIRQGEKKSINDDIISVWNKDKAKRDMYVHEWQNLWFALTGEELTIK